MTALLLDCTILSWATVGGGPFRHAEYKCEVSFEGEKWIIYRRFSAFVGLDRQIRALLGEKVEDKETWTAVLPDKVLMGGTLASSFTSVVSNRLGPLQRYLSAVLKYDTSGGERREVDKILSQFFDIENKGASGAAMELGGKNLVREVFARTRDATSIFSLWHNYFLVISRRGNAFTLYVLRSMYEKIADAVLTIPLSQEGMVVTSTPSNCLQADIKGPGVHLCLQFTTQDEAAAWLRCIADCVIPDTSALKVQKLTTEQRKQKAQQTRLEEASAAERNRSAVTEDIRDAGTGNTEDELSSVWGM